MTQPPLIDFPKIMKKESPAEGLVFCHQDGRMAKLHRDMFDWYEEPRHGD